jgi:opacity protein-like surface antigen
VVSRIAAKAMGDVRSGRIPRRLLPCFLALAFLVFDAAPGSAQWPEVERWLDGSQPLTLGLGTSRFRVSTLGTKPVIAIEDPSYGGAPYRLIDSDLYGRAISFDLKLRWPPLSATGTSGLGAVEPYFSFGPTLFVAGSDNALRLGQPGSRSEGAMSLGLSWGAGLSWRFTRNAELFGGYRFMQYGREGAFSRGERSSPETDLIGHDVLYGISVRF